jgi:hypothetical protein
MAALKPAQSPPLVKTPILLIFPLIMFRPNLARPDTPLKDNINTHFGRDLLRYNLFRQA